MPATADEAADSLGDDALSLDIRYRRGILDIERGRLGAAVAMLEAANCARAGSAAGPEPHPSRTTPVP
ncbi:hypothetical protein ACIA8C_21635 [Nocardia sp. NPDC051321]|uniref:hypothetical protein n=1 Tax=Nocardia sp. NPDC051321 TaxID=3364323 RepID=UPI0037B77C00